MIDVSGKGGMKFRSFREADLSKFGPAVSPTRSSSSPRALAPLRARSYESAFLHTSSRIAMAVATLWDLGFHVALEWKILGERLRGR